MKQILVIKPSSLGDIIHGLMVMEALRRERPQLQIDWVVRDIFAPFVQACETVRNSYIFHRKGGLAAFGQLVTQIREVEYDAVVDLQGLARSGLLGLLSGVPRRNRYGRSDARELSWLTYGRRAPLPEALSIAGTGKCHNKNGTAPAHAVDILRQFLPLFGVDVNVPLGTLHFRQEQCSPQVAALLDSGRPLVLLFPESRRPEKEWGDFPALTQLLLERGALRADDEGNTPLVCWLGSSAVDDAGMYGSTNFINLTGRTSIAELPALMGAAAAVVANDSGPMHLAAAMGKKVVALFGPTDPSRYGPYPLSSPDHCVLRAQSGRLADISPAEVATAVCDLLRKEQ